MVETLPLSEGRDHPFTSKCRPTGSSLTTRYTRKCLGGRRTKFPTTEVHVFKGPLPTHRTCHLQILRRSADKVFIKPVDWLRFVKRPTVTVTLFVLFQKREIVWFTLFPLLLSLGCTLLPSVKETVSRASNQDYSFTPLFTPSPFDFHECR